MLGHNQQIGKQDSDGDQTWFHWSEELLDEETENETHSRRVWPNYILQEKSKGWKLSIVQIMIHQQTDKSQCVCLCVCVCASMCVYTHISETDTTNG